MRHLILTFLACGLLLPARAQIIAYTSFEEPAVVGGQYTDTGDAATDHALADNASEPVVNFSSGVDELGFTSFYTNTRDDVGLTDGDFVGVTDFTGDFSEDGYPDGDNGFQIGDADGKMTVTLETVDLTDVSDPRIYLQYFIPETGWELTDALRIWVEDAGGTEVVLLDSDGGDIDDLTIEGSWTQVFATLDGFTTATLHFELDSNASTEELYVDAIAFTDGELPPGPLPVELTSFEALQHDGGVALAWTTASELNNAGFEVQHRAAPGPFETVGFVAGKGTTHETQAYTYRLDALAPGRHVFRLKQVDFDGAFEYSPEVEVAVELTERFSLSEAYPNPFNPATHVTLAVDRRQAVRVEVFDVLGRRVRTLFAGTLEAHAPQTFTFDARALPSGVYRYRVTGEAFVATRQVTLLK